MPPILKIRTELAVPLNADDLAAAGALPQQIQDYLASTPGVVVTKWKVDMVAPRKAPVSCLAPRLPVDFVLNPAVPPDTMVVMPQNIPPALDRRPGKEVE